MTRCLNKPITCANACNPLRGMAVRAIWSRAISSRADSKQSPCVARPNLFSGD